MLAKALFEKIPILIKINKFILKKLVKGKIAKNSISYKDLKDYDYQIYKSIKFMAEDQTVDYESEDFKFVVIRDDGDEIDLIKNGS